MAKRASRCNGKGAEGMDRRQLVRTAVLSGLAAVVGGGGRGRAAPATAAPALPEFPLEEVTIAELSARMAAGELTSRSVCQAYLERIAALDPTLRSVIEVNPDALAIAEALDHERTERGPRGPLHGIPVLIKDNIATADRMETTAGSLALLGARPAEDAFLVQRLRAAGAVILGKTNLSEWANFRSTHSSSGWSGRGGQCRNPYALDRNPCGSSSGTGVAVAANLAAVGVGSETDGSIVCPSHACSLVGIKPTLGAVSRSGIVPIAHSQDTAGPMARTVADAACLLGVLVGVDPRDPATAAGRGRTHADYTRFLDPQGLGGARIGVARAKVTGYSPEADAVFASALAAMKEAGATLVDPADIPHLGEYDEAEFEVLLYEFKADLEAYLAALPGGEAPRTLADLIAFNRQHQEEELRFFGQEIFERAAGKGPLSDAAYRKALRRCRELSRRRGLDVVFEQHRLDAIVAPTGSPPWPIDLVNGDHFQGASSTPAAVSGYPAITVPAGYSFGLPVGVTFIGRDWAEPVLLRLASGFEAATRVRRPPRFLPTAELGSV
jgi:amidase